MIVALFDHFFEMADFDHRFSCSFISRICKTSCPASLNDFNLISLLGWVHKLVSRVLATRLKRVIRKLVRESQSAFVKGRNIFG